jgi:hypothetical protein
MYWNFDDTTFVCIRAKEEALPIYRSLKTQTTGQIRFVLAHSTREFLAELASPSLFSTTASAYYICNPRLGKNKTIKWRQNNDEFQFGKQLTQNGNPLCEPCFLEGTCVGKCSKHKPATPKRKAVQVPKTRSKAQRVMRGKQLRTMCVCGRARPSFEMPGKRPPLYCKQCAPAGAIDVISKRCVCKKSRACFGLPGTRIRLYCKVCKPENAVLVGKKCVCGKAKPSFCSPIQPIASWCSECKPADAVSAYRKLCECGTCASFNLPGETIVKWCSKCAPSNAVNVTKKKCACGLASAHFAMIGTMNVEFCANCKPENTFIPWQAKCECTKSQPSLNFPGELKGRWCRLCPGRHPNAVNVVSRRCECGLSLPKYGFSGDFGATFCATCKPPNAIDIGHKFCECGSRPQFGLIGKPATNCRICKTKHMIKFPTKKCVFANCKELALYGEDTRCRCEAHKFETDQNLGERICVSCGLMEVLNAQNKCFACDPETIKRITKRHEEAVKDLLKQHGIDFTNNKVPNGTQCGLERPDFVIYCKTHIVIVEVDESQHKHYLCLCEQTRMVNITQTFGGLPVLWIRFNPDKFVPQGHHASLDVSQNTRHNILLKWVKGAMQQSSFTCLSEVMYLFFDDCNQSTYATEWQQLPSI